MKNITPKYWVLICFVLINLGVSAQINNIYKIPSDSQVVTLVEEVYSENSEKEIFNRKARYNFIKNLLQKRIVVTSDKDILNKIEDEVYLSEVPVFNTFNASLKKPLSFNLANFNPLIYNINWYDVKPHYYKIDNQNLLLIVFPQEVNNTTER
ncbi:MULTISPECIES: hypothetical protein [Croceibacter]|jgi:hypothetical protein|uniref:hypothetical protein n=1 Tax=Croceibacter TaxID=216431 RepID=UPI000C56D987|nr:MULTISPECIES: hypothetical protein [Croceibacter]MBG24589.1 hypothetical protein [Croceibacter sp.]WSP34858.1 hypothetical protein VVL01_02020 [Croceibacter atlanticus]|tara:strand:+ start:78 stop:536 length:459 start_codon:yes stop_codon:yes gene_type:complete